MKVNELKELIDGCIIEVPKDDCFLAMAKSGVEVSVAFEGQLDMLTASLVRLMKKYKDLATIVCCAADDYEMEAE